MHRGSMTRPGHVTQPARGRPGTQSRGPILGDKRRSASATRPQEGLTPRASEPPRPWQSTQARTCSMGTRTHTHTHRQPAAQSHLIPPSPTHPIAHSFPHFLPSSKKYPRVSRRKQTHLKASAEQGGWKRCPRGSSLWTHPQDYHPEILRSLGSRAPDMEETEVTLDPGVVSPKPAPLQGLPWGLQWGHLPPFKSLTVISPNPAQHAHAKILLTAQGLTLVKTPHRGGPRLPPGIICQETPGCKLPLWGDLAPHRHPQDTSMKTSYKAFPFSSLLSAPGRPSRDETIFRNAYGKILSESEVRAKRKVRDKVM